MRFRHGKLSGACGLVLFAAAAAPPALAFDPSGSEVADALMKTLEATGADNVTYESVSSDGSITTIRGLTSAREADGDKNTISAESVDITGGAVSDDGALSADDLTVSGLTMAKDGDESRVGAATASVKGLMLPAPASIASDTAIGATAKYDSFVMDRISVAEPGKPELTINKVETAILGRENGAATSGELRVSEIRIPVEALGEEDGSAAHLKSLGYEQIEIDLYGKGGWDATSGQSSLEELRLDADDIGKLTLKLGLGGVTQEVIDGLQKDQQDFSEMLTLLNNVTIQNLSVSYDDDGLTKRIIEKNAEEQGVDKQAFIDQITGMMPVMLAVLQNPDFEKSIIDAVTAFLNQPQNITVVAAPANPVPVAQIFGVAMMAPQTIPSVLSVSVSANE